MTRVGSTHDTIPFRTGAEQVAAVRRAVDHLVGGGLIAYPTETVYGFGCVLEEAPLVRLAALKGRPTEKPFLILVADGSVVDGLLWTASAHALARAFWPGPLTLALRVAPSAYPAQVVGSRGTVAVRATSHSGVALILEALAGPLTSTSANLPGSAPARSAMAVKRVLDASPAEGPILVLDGGTLPQSQPSTLVDCSVEPPHIIRAGAISAERLAECINGIDATEY